MVNKFRFLWHDKCVLCDTVPVKPLSAHLVLILTSKMRKKLEMVLDTSYHIVLGETENSHILCTPISGSFRDMELCAWFFTS